MSEVVKLNNKYIEVPKLFYVSVSKGNDDTGDGSKNLPFASIKKVCSVAPAESGIILDKGDYNVIVDKVGMFKNKYKIFGSGVKTRILTDGVTPTDDYTANVSFYNIYFERVTNNGYTDASIFYFYGVKHLHFYNCYFKRYQYGNEWMLFINSGHPDYKDKVLFQNCTFDSTERPNIPISRYGMGTIKNCAFTGKPDVLGSNFIDCIYNVSINDKMEVVSENTIKAGARFGDYLFNNYSFIFNGKRYSYNGIHKNKLCIFSSIDEFYRYKYHNDSIDKDGYYLANTISDKYDDKIPEEIKSKYSYYTENLDLLRTSITNDIVLEDENNIKFSAFNIENVVFLYKKNSTFYMCNKINVQESDFGSFITENYNSNDSIEFIPEPNILSNGLKTIEVPIPVFYSIENFASDASNAKILIRINNNLYGYNSNNSELNTIQQELSPEILNTQGVPLSNAIGYINTISNKHYYMGIEKHEIIYTDDIKMTFNLKIISSKIESSLNIILFTLKDSIEEKSIPVLIRTNISLDNSIIGHLLNNPILIADLDDDVQSVDGILSVHVDSQPTYKLSFDNGLTYSGYNKEKSIWDPEYFMTKTEIESLTPDIYLKLIDSSDIQGLYSQPLKIRSYLGNYNEYKNPTVNKIGINYVSNQKVAITNPMLSVNTTHLENVKLTAILRDYEGGNISYKVSIKKPDNSFTTYIDWNEVDPKYNLDTDITTTEHLGIGENLIKIEARETGGLVSNWIGKVTVVNNSPIVSITNTNFSMSANISDPDSDRVTVQVEIDGKVIFPYKTELHEYLNSPTVFNYTWDPKYIHFGRDHIVTLKVKDILGGEKSTSFNIKGEYRTILLLDDRGRLYSNGAGDKIKALSMGRIPIPGESEVYKVNIKNNTNEVINTLIIKPDISKPENTTPKFSLSNDPYNWVDQLSHSSVINHGDTIPLYIKVEVSNTGTASSVEFPIIIEAAN